MASNIVRPVKQSFHLIDATDQVIGRLATTCARILCGKHKPTYSPHSLKQGDYVVVINAKHAKFTGTKFENKLYRWHTGFQLKEATPRHITERLDRPELLVTKAVSGMLPKNRLRDRRMKMLFVYPESNHPLEKFVDKFPAKVSEPKAVYNL